MLYFADGSAVQHTAVFGCDGIKSRIRSVVLADDRTAPAVFSGKYAYRGLVPMDKAVDILGEDEPRTPQLHLGYGGHVLTFPIANGKILNGKVALLPAAVRSLMLRQWWLSRLGQHGKMSSG